MNYLIRRARHSDAEGIIYAHVTSIQETCSRDYNQLEISAWSGRKFKPHLWCQVMDRDFVWVIELDGKVEGFGHFAVMDEERGEVMGLYLTPVVQSRGGGRGLLNEMIKVARTHKLKKVNLFSTRTARTFYEAQGFFQSGGDTSIEMQGVSIECYPMELQVSEN